MGYWSNFFYEDQNTWTSTVADVCSTIVSYGVEIPWCVCNNSWNVINTVTEYATFLFMLVSNALQLDVWWRVEFTAMLVLCLLNLPFYKYRSQGSSFKTLSQFLFMLTFLGLGGTFFQMTSGIQTGLLFGGKLFFPSLLLMSLVCQFVKLVLIQLDKEIYGWGYNEEVKKDERLTKTLTAFRNCCSAESVGFLALAAFGLPQWEQNPDLSTWLVVIPFLSMYKDAKDYFDNNSLVDKSVTEKQNGDVVAKETTKPVETKKPEPAKDEKKAAPEKSAEPATNSTEEPKKACGLKALGCNACATVCRLTSTVTRPICNAVFFINSKVEWELITNLILRYGVVATFTWTFWTLTEDPIVLGFPLFSTFVPMAISKFVAGKVSKNWETVLMEMCLCGSSGLQYYIYKSNIIQYN